MTSHFLSGWEASHWEIVVLWSRAGAKSISNLSRDKENGFPPLQTPAELNESIWGREEKLHDKINFSSKRASKNKVKGHYALCKAKSIYAEVTIGVSLQLVNQQIN